MNYNCYILKSNNAKFINRTYVGSTNLLSRRIRQHNGEIKGGACATAITRPNEIFCYISGFKNKIIALKSEWLLKHPDGSSKRNIKYSGIKGRLDGINELFNNSEKWKIINDGSELCIYIKEEYKEYLNLDNVRIYII
jgi:predicted GIY-YIG superfamily endonuclease